ncbi:MAG: YfhO family protein [Clostridia bacterium]|nr:YfhO family protein [Clostridia bacterium]
MKNNPRKLNPVTVCFVLAAAVPALVMLLQFALLSCAPFGKNSFCTMDGFSQYYPMLENMSRALHNGELFYSFSGGLGFNLWSQSAYYTNSPLWIFLYILPQSTHIAVVNLTVMLRFCLASLFFCIYLHSHRRITERRIFPYTALSAAYAFCGWAVAFQNQFMWMDCMLLLPLVILGIEKLFDGKSPVLYTVTLFMCIWSCFYIAYMVCIFAAIWALKLTVEEKRSLRESIKKLFRFAVYSVLAAEIAAVSLLPLLHTISQTKASDIGLESARSYGTVLNLIFNMLPFTPKSLEYGAPNVYCTVSALIMAVVSAFNKKIPLRKKLTSAFIWLFLILSFEINALYYVWHGFHFPNQLPGRFSFVYVFFVLVCASAFIEYNTFVPTGEHFHPVRMKQSAAVLFVLVLAGACTNFTARITSNPDSLLKFSQIGAEFKQKADEKNSFSRQELEPLKSNNQGLQYGYHGIGWYSSTMSAAQYDFFQALGMPKYAKNVSTYYEGTEITNALFSVRYSADPETGEVSENKMLLPLAFLADEKILDFDIPAHKSGKQTQKALWFALCGENLNVKDGTDKLNRCGFKIDSFSSDNITGAIGCEKDGVFFTTIPDDGGWQIYIDGEKTEPLRTADLLLCCKISKGQHTVSMKYVPPMFKSGAIISAISLAAAILLILSKKKRKSY